MSLNPREERIQLDRNKEQTLKELLVLESKKNTITRRSATASKKNKPILDKEIQKIKTRKEELEEDLKAFNQRLREVNAIIDKPRDKYDEGIIAATEELKNKNRKIYDANSTKRLYTGKETRRSTNYLQERIKKIEQNQAFNKEGPNLGGKKHRKSKKARKSKKNYWFF